MCGYRGDNKVYLCCIPARWFALFAAGITLCMHITFGVFFIVYDENWGAFPLCATLVAHILFVIADLGCMPFLLRIYVIFEVLYALSMMGVGCWLLTFNINPKGTFLFDYCLDNAYFHCQAWTREEASIWGATFIVFFVINIGLVQVFRNVAYAVTGGRRGRRRSSSCHHHHHHQQPTIYTTPQPTAVVIQQQPQHFVVSTPAQASTPVYTMPQPSTPYPQHAAYNAQPGPSVYPNPEATAPPPYEEKKY